MTYIDKFRNYIKTSTNTDSLKILEGFITELSIDEIENFTQEMVLLIIKHKEELGLEKLEVANII